MTSKLTPHLSLLDNSFLVNRKRIKGDILLEQVDSFINWSKLTALCEKTLSGFSRDSKGTSVRFCLKCLFLQFLYNLKSADLEDVITDRLSFQRFLGINFVCEQIDFASVRKFREGLMEHGMYDTLFEPVLSELGNKGFILNKG